MATKPAKHSAAKAIPEPLSSSAPDRLSGLNQQLFDMICNHVVNAEDNIQNSAIRALHCTSKVLYDKTATWVCRSGIMMIESGLETLLRMASTPQVAPRINYIKLLYPADEDFYRWSLKDELDTVVSVLKRCFANFNNLQKIELKSLPTKGLRDIEEEEDASVSAPWTWFPLEWPISSLLDVLRSVGAHITELTYDETLGAWAWGTGEDRKYEWYPSGILSHSQLACLQDIKTFRVVDTNSSLGYPDRHYTKEMLEAMPNLKDLTITTPDYARWRGVEDMWGMVGWGYYIGTSNGQCPSLACKRYEPNLQNWAQAVLHSNYSWRLTSFHVNNCSVDDLELFSNFLLTHSSTLQDLSFTNIAVLDTSYTGSDCSRVAQHAWCNLFQIILDETSLLKGRFGGLTHWFCEPSRPSEMAVRAATCWEPDESPALDSSDAKFAEIAEVRGVMRALEDWMEGMAMLPIDTASECGDGLN